MKFDVVCGNPPYNNDIYLDFVMLGHKLAKSYDLWITPSRYMLYDSVKNDLFRQSVVPYMHEIVHYQNEADIFQIVMPCGISYYICGKELHSDKYVTSKSTHIEGFNSERVLYSNFKCNDSLLYIGHCIIERLGSFQRFSCNRLDGKFNAFATKAIRGFYLGGSDKHIYSATPVTRPIHIYPDEQVAPNARILYSSDSRSEVESFISYIETKLIRFLILLSATGYSYGVEFKYYFVPDPGSFDKVYEDKPLEGYTPDESGIYTDYNGVVHCSLYVKYKLTDEEIEIIESVIKDR